MRRIVHLSRLAVSSLFILTMASALSYAQTYNESVLYSPSSLSAGTDLAPQLIQARDGNFYGVAVDGSGTGSTIFKVSPTGAYSAVYTFPASNVYVGLTEGSDGNLYGVLQTGGAAGTGAIFSVSPSGTYTLLYSFCANSQSGCPDGNQPIGALVLGSDGDFYGTAGGGGANGFGTIFKISSAGQLTTLYSFCSQGGSACTDGRTPLAGLVQASDGNFYGTTNQGGTDCSANTGLAGGCGTVFRITPAGAYSVIYSFTGGTDGGFPASRLVQGANGNLYGTTEFQSGIPTNPETYEITLDGSKLTTLYVLSPSMSDIPAYEDGLFLASDGNFYGTVPGVSANAQYGNPDSTIYQITPPDSVNTVYTFPGVYSASVGSVIYPNGVYPETPPVQGADGNFYGTTECGGNYSVLGGGNTTCDGVVYKLAVSPSLSPPVVLTLNSGNIQANESVTLNWSVANAFSVTMQQCYASIQGSPNGAGTWTGLQAGTFNASGTPPYSGSATITPTADGVYTYALTCGGMESGFATLIVGTPPTLSVTTNSLPTGQVGTAYSQTVSATGGIAPYSWSVSSGSLPAGLSLSSGTGIISGTPTSIGTSSFTIQVKDSESTPQTATGNLSITINPAALAITTSSLPNGVVGTAYSQTLQVSGGVPPYSYALTSGSLPAGLSLSSGTGVISGTPTSIGTSSFTIQVKDSESTPQTATGNLSIIINPAALAITTSSLPNGVVGTPYSQTLQVSGGVPPYSYALTSGSLPTPLQLDTPTGSITGTPTTPGTSNFSITVKDSESPAASVTSPFSITVAGFTLSPAPATVSVPQGGGGTSTITVADVGGFSGTVALTVTGLPNGVTASFAAGSTPGTQVLSLMASASAQVTSSPVIVTITGTSGTATAMTSISLSVTSQPAFTAGSGGTTSISVAPGATTGNTGTISVVGVNGFSGTINLSCAITTSMTNVSDMPSCSLNPSNVVISGTTAQTSILTVSTTAATSARSDIKMLIWPTEGTALSLVMFLVIPRRRRNWLAISGMLLLFLSIGVVGCGGGGSSSVSGGGGTGNPGTTAGNYTITVTGTAGSVSATVGTIALTVQ